MLDTGPEAAAGRRGTLPCGYPVTMEHGGRHLSGEGLRQITPMSSIADAFQWRSSALGEAPQD